MSILFSFHKIRQKTPLFILTHIIPSIHRLETAILPQISIRQRLDPRVHLYGRPRPNLTACFSIAHSCLPKSCPSSTITVSKPQPFQSAPNSAASQ